MALPFESEVWAPVSEVPVVDMLAIARKAQWSASAFSGAGSMKVVAPAKVNLFLGVGQRRPDGYHDVVNVMHALALHDVLYVRHAPLSPDRALEVERAASGASAAWALGGPDDNILVSVECVDKTGGTADVLRAGVAQSAASRAAANGAKRAAAKKQGAAGERSASDEQGATAGEQGVAPAEVSAVDEVVPAEASASTLPGTLDVATRDNLVFAAIDALAHALGRFEREEVIVRLEKHIPHQAGLGGGSSDAAAALVAMAHAWGVSSDDPALLGVAQKLGADVAFFLQGGCALLTGAGECAKRSLAPMKHALVLVKPQAGVSTAQAYRAFDEQPVAVPEQLLAAALEAACACEVPLYNNLAFAAERTSGVLGDVRTWLAAQPGVQQRLSDQGECVPEVLLCGSGSTTFAVVDDFSAACRIAAAAQARGWWARATTFSSLRAARGRV